MKTYIKYSLVVAFSLTLSSCFLFEQSSSENLGHIHVSAILVADTCGPGVVSSGSSMAYDIELQRNGSAITWIGPGGSRSGTMTDDENFCIELSANWNERESDPWLGDPGCEMVHLEQLCGTLEFEDQETDEETGPIVARITATHEAYVSGTQGSDCSDQIGITEGLYLSLPCQVVYEITGERAEDF